MKTVLATVLLLSSSLGADKAALTRALAACGPVDIRFDVTRDDSRRPEPQTQSEKALVYVIQDGELPCIVCSTTTRVGVDGTWVGANDDNSYFYFYLTPGEHHLCTDQQTQSEEERVVALSHFTAEPGKTYYFRTRVKLRILRERSDRLWTLDLDPINNDEGQLLVASYKVSNWRPKK